MRTESLIRTSRTPGKTGDCADPSKDTGHTWTMGITGSGAERVVTTGRGARADEIRLIAGRLFEERGYSAATMTDIADAVGIFPGSLYHHFESKEAIDVDIQQELDRSLNVLAAALSKATADSSPEERLRYLVREVMKVSVANAAAVRLMAYEAPTIATERLRSALKLQVPVLERAWRTATDTLLATVPASGTDAGLLRFAFRTMSMQAGVQYPAGSDPDVLAQQLCDVLLHGVLTNCPADEVLDNSDAAAAAADAVSSWQPRGQLRPADLDVRQAIITAARTEFARRGFEATTIRDVAVAAGVTMATLYRRVESKEAILREVIATFAGNLDKAVRAALTTGSSAAASLDALAKVFVVARRQFHEESEIVKFRLEQSRFGQQSDARLLPGNPGPAGLGGRNHRTGHSRPFRPGAGRA